MKKPGLVLVGTPIGNLDDISFRAIKELQGADAICCEDTRRTGKLLAHLQCSPRPPLIVVNEHTEKQQCEIVISKIQNGSRLVMVTDAGMPAISDPGEFIVSQVAQAGLSIEVVPGPSAGIAALVGSGIPSRRYFFEGFLPRKGAERTNRLQELARSSHTVVLFESPRRISKTLKDLSEYLGENRRAAIARELTKIHEEYLRGTLGQLAQSLSAKEVRGEIVIILEGSNQKELMSTEEILSALNEAKKHGLSTRDAVREVASVSGISKKQVYELYLSSTRN
tara:strand:+ start:2729 stop:3571 length:843 start_codon:yes stop_codon:yes gene_type:complete